MRSTILCLLLVSQQLAQASGPTPSRILAAFRQDAATCKSMAKLLETDPQFRESIRVAVVSRRPVPLDTMLRQSPHAATPAFRRVLANLKYFEFDISMHGDPWAIAWVPNTGVFCARTFERLREVEALGVSDEAWTIREEFLTLALEGLGEPGIEMEGGNLNFEEFRKHVLEAAARYAKSRPRHFRAWIRKAVAAVEKMRGGIVDGSAGLSSAQQGKKLDDWIGFLNKVGAN